MIDVYSWPTPNGHKVHIMLEECGLRLGRDWVAHPVNIGQGDQFKPEFLKISPNNKIPALVDPHGPDGKPISLFESGAILLYLASKTGKFLPKSDRAKFEVLQWLMFQMGGVGPMFGQLGFFHKFAGKDFEDKRPRDRYVAESKRLLNVLNQHLATRSWMMGDAYTIADIAIFLTEELGFHPLARRRGKVDHHEPTVAATAHVVQRPRDQFLTGAGLAIDQHRGSRIRDRVDQLADRAHRLAVANDGTRLSHKVGLSWWRLKLF